MKRHTRQGEVILAAIKTAGRPLTPLEIHQLASKKIPRLGIATTYRHIKTLSESHQVVGVDYPGQPPRYEWADGQDKVHFACRACDKLFALESENLGFKIEGSKILELLQGSVVPEMVKMLEVLKEESFLLACLTNNFNANEDKSALDNNNQERQRILGLFDYIIESREVGVRKPEGEFYEIALNITGCNPKEVIFLDDLGINLKPAKALGMTTIKVVDHIESIKELCEYLEIGSEKII